MVAHVGERELFVKGLEMLPELCEVSARGGWRLGLALWVGDVCRCMQVGRGCRGSDCFVDACGLS